VKPSDGRPFLSGFLRRDSSNRGVAFGMGRPENFPESPSRNLRDVFVFLDKTYRIFYGNISRRRARNATLGGFLAFPRDFFRILHDAAFSVPPSSRENGTDRSDDTMPLSSMATTTAAWAQRMTTNFSFELPGI
jgi:hypothetical protein